MSHVGRALLRATATASLLITLATVSHAQASTYARALKHVTIRGYAFHPSVLVIAPGTVVQWTNRDPAPHTVTFAATIGGSGRATRRTHNQHRFLHPGTYTYHCQFHAFMMATVRVVRSHK